MPSPAIGLSPLALLVGRRLEGHAVVLRGSVPEVMRELKRFGYKGLIAFEYEKEGEINEDVASQIAYARKFT